MNELERAMSSCTYLKTSPKMRCRDLVMRVICIFIGTVFEPDAKSPVINAAKFRNEERYFVVPYHR